MSTPKAVVMSMWRNDANRGIARRIAHLLGKTYPNVRYQWTVGDSTDATEDMLHSVAAYHPADITVVRYDTGIVGDDADTRLRRLSETFDASLDLVNHEDELVVLHESDLRTPADIIERFIATGKDAVAGWPTLYTGTQEVFYDTWAYRINGVMLTNFTPRPTELFRVDSFGSCWLCPAEDIRAGARSHGAGVVGVCHDMRAMGRELWVDPSIDVVQPPEFFTAHQHAAVTFA